MKQGTSEDFSLGFKLLTAGTAACIADLATFPLDTAKVRMQVSGKIIPITVRVFFRKISFSFLTIEIMIFQDCGGRTSSVTGIGGRFSFCSKSESARIVPDHREHR